MEFLALQHLFGAYLHQDWTDEFSTMEEAILTFKNHEPAENTLAVCNELEQLIVEISVLDNKIDFLRDKLMCYYTPFGGEAKVLEWLEQVQNLLRCKKI